MSVLIVDDDPVLVDPAKKLPWGGEHSLFTAVDSDSAIQILRENPDIRLVIVDYDVRHRRASDFVVGVRKATAGKKIWVVRNDSRPRADFCMESWMFACRVEKFMGKTEAIKELQSFLIG